MIFLLGVSGALPVTAQEAANRTSISGTVVDGDTGETLPFVQIYFLKSTSDKGMVASEIGTTSDLDGKFELSNTMGFNTLNFQMVGYKTEMLTLRKGQSRKDVKIKMTPDVYGLQDIVVTPKNRKRDYKRKGNPAVELIQHVIANKYKHCVLDDDHYSAKTYSRMSFAFDNLKINWNKRFWKNFEFVKKYIDTTGVYPSVTVSIRENLAEEYYQRKPHREKKIIKQKRIFGIEDILASGTFQENVNAIFKDVDINDNNMNLLFNRFVSPLNSTIATTFYQYYIMDTIMVDGYPCIDLAFVPVNSESYGFTGHLYIVNDSTWRLKKYAINVPPDINLNFVSNFSIEHSYKQLEDGTWAPDRTSTYAKFYILNNKRGMLARQTKIYTHWDRENPIPKGVFSSFTADDEVQQDDTTAVRVASREWVNLRPEPLSWYESSVEDLVHEFTSNRKFNDLALFANAITTEFLPTTKSADMWESKFDFGPIFQFVSWNMLEGVRLRVGGTSTGRLNPHWFFRGYTAFGTKDLRPKGNFTVMYTFDKHKRQPYSGIRHHLLVAGQYDVEVPGLNTDAVARDHLFNSIPTSKPTMGFFQYVAHAQGEYMKEWQNKLSIRTTFDFSRNAAAGALQYNRVDWTMNADSTWAPSYKPVNWYYDYEALVELRYAPGCRVYIDKMGRESQFAMEVDAPILKVSHWVGYLDDRMNGGRGFVHNRTEITFDKRFWFSAFGHLDLRVQTGMIWQKVPFTKLYMPPTSTGIFLAMRSFNQMQPMEFLMDEYASLYATYYFKGWILNRIPGINKLKLRGVVGVSAVYGGLTKKNNPFLHSGSGLYEIPQAATFNDKGYYVAGSTTSPIGKLPYIEINAGFENILKFFRIDYIRRITYNDYKLPYMVTVSEPELDNEGVPTGQLVDKQVRARRRVPKWGRNGVKISVRFAL
jgi:hypothetical protein